MTTTSGARALVFGTGRMARLRAERLKTAGMHVDVTSRDVGRAREAAGVLKVAPVTYAEAVSRSYDCAVVASASEDHAGDLEAVLDRVPTVFCEKPVTTSLTQAVRLRAAAEASGCEVFVGFQRRFDPAIAALRLRVRRGELGTLLHVRASDFDRRAGSAAFIAKSGGMFKDLVIHDLDWITWTTGVPVASVHVHASVLVSADYAAADDCDVATVSLVLADGTLATVNASRSHPTGQDVRVEVLGTSAAVSVGLTARTPLQPVDGDLRLGVGGAPQDFMERFSDAFRRETDGFAAHVQDSSNSFDGCSLGESIVALEVAEACDRSWRTGTEIRLPDQTGHS